MADDLNALIAEGAALPEAHGNALENPSAMTPQDAGADYLLQLALRDAEALASGRQEWVYYGGARVDAEAYVPILRGIIDRARS